MSKVADKKNFLLDLEKSSIFAYIFFFVTMLLQNARKRGRKPRKVVTDTEATQQFVVESTSWPSERQSESQLQLFKRTKPCEKEEDERKLNCTTLDIRGKRPSQYLQPSRIHYIYVKMS